MSGLGALLAIVASLAFGTSNVLSRAAVRRHSTVSLALWAQTTGLILVSVLALLRQLDLAAAGLAWGATAGGVGALAGLAFYTALQRGRTSVVTSVRGAGVVAPVVAGVASGDPTSWRSSAGTAAAIAGVLIVTAASGRTESRGPNRPLPAPASSGWACGAPGRFHLVPTYDGCVPARARERSRSAAWLAAASAAGFGIFFVVLKAATGRADPQLENFDNAVAVSLAVQVGALMVTLVAATQHSRRCLRPRRAVLVAATGIGVLDLGGDLVLTLAVSHGPLSVIGPLARVVAVVLTSVLLRKRLRSWELAGVLTAVAGAVLETGVSATSSRPASPCRPDHARRTPRDRHGERRDRASTPGQ